MERSEQRQILGEDGELINPILACDSDQDVAKSRKHLFLVNPDNARFINGDHYQPFQIAEEGIESKDRKSRRSWGKTFGALTVIVLGISLFHFLATNWSSVQAGLFQADLLSLALLILLLVAIPALFVTALAIDARMQKRRAEKRELRLTRQGTLIRGEIIEFEPRDPDSSEHALLTYRFLTPDSKEIVRTEQILRTVISEPRQRETRPRVGRAVAVLYADDGLYQLL